MTRFVNLESDESAERVIDERPRPTLVKRETPFQLIDDIAQDASERPVPWIIHDMAYLQGTFLVPGAPKVGKSTMLADIMRARLDNAQWAGKDVKTGPVLLLTEEGPMPTAFRWHRASGMHVLLRYIALQAWTEARDDATFGDGPPPGIGGEAADHIRDYWSFQNWLLREVGEWLDENPRALVIVDTLAVWSGMADENDASEATRSISVWTRLAQEYNACVLLVHHMRKGGGSNGEAIRGSSAILGTADGYWEVTRVSDAPTDTRRKVNVITRMSFPLTMTVSYDRETGLYTEVTKDAVAPTAETWLDAIPEDGEGITLALLGTRWGIGRSTVQDRLARLEADGLVRKDTVKAGRTSQLRYWREPSASRPSGTFRDVFKRD